MSQIKSALDLCPEGGGDWSHSPIGLTEPSAQFKPQTRDGDKIKINNRVTDERWLHLAKFLDEKDEEKTFTELTKELGLQKDYTDNYKESAIDLFSKIASRAPCVIEKTLKETSYSGDVEAGSSYVPNDNALPEKGLVAYFKWIYARMEEVTVNSSTQTTETHNTTNAAPNASSNYVEDPASSVAQTADPQNTAINVDNYIPSSAQPATWYPKNSLEIVIDKNPNLEGFRKYAGPNAGPTARGSARDTTRGSARGTARYNLRHTRSTAPTELTLDDNAYLDPSTNVESGSSSGDNFEPSPGTSQPTDPSTNISAPQDVGAGVPTSPSPVNIPFPKYRFDDHQDRPVDGGNKLRPDGAFRPRRFVSYCLKTIHVVFEAKVRLQRGLVSDKILGQIGDYVREVWKQQFTRTLIPVIYLSGGYVWLLIFTPGEWHQCKLGPICHDKENILEEDIKEVSQTLAQLYYILTLRDIDFGHFCPMAKVQKAMKFTHKTTNNPDDSLDASEHSENVLTETEFVSGGEGSFKLTDPIHPKVSVCGGRMSHIFRDNKYCCKDGQTRPAILKLSWTPVKRLPEGLIYEYLHRSKDKELTDKIPEVYDSGIVSKDVFGYRVEYIIMENCGEAIKEYVLKQAEDGVIVETVCKNLLSWLKDAVSIIGYACVHSVLHRDISTGNILIGKKGLKIADWGLAKIKKEELLKQTDLAKKWLLTNVEKVAQNEEHHDKLTGTPLYTGIRILAGAEKRGLIDDIESIWDSTLHLWSLYKKGVINTSNTAAYMLCQSKLFAYLRGGCVTDRNAYMELFGAEGMPKGELRDFLDRMYELLFVDDNGAMGMRMALAPGSYLRLYNSLNLKWLFGDDLSEKLKTENLGNSSPPRPKAKGKEVAEPQAQYGSPTQAEGTEGEELQISQQPGFNIRDPSRATLQPLLGQFQRVSKPVTSWSTPVLPETGEYRRVDVSTAMTRGGKRSNNAWDIHERRQSQLQGQGLLTTISEEPEMQKEDGKYSEEEVSALPQAVNRQRQQLTHRQGSSNSQDTSRSVGKRKRTGINKLSKLRKTRSG